jgi:hypothetical protein
MAPSEDALDNKARRLIEAIEQVRDDVWKVEVWASAFQSFSSSVPIYEPSHWSSAAFPHGPPVLAE